LAIERVLRPAAANRTIRARFKSRCKCHRRAATCLKHLAVSLRKVDFSGFGYHPDVESRLTSFREQGAANLIRSLEPTSPGQLGECYGRDVPRVRWNNSLSLPPALRPFHSWPIAAALPFPQSKLERTSAPPWSRLARDAKESDGEGEQHKASECVDSYVQRTDHWRITPLAILSSCDTDVGRSVRRQAQRCHRKGGCLIAGDARPPLFSGMLRGRPKWFHGRWGESARALAPIGRPLRATKSRRMDGLPRGCSGSMNFMDADYHDRQHRQSAAAPIKPTDQRRSATNRQLDGWRPQCPVGPSSRCRPFHLPQRCERSATCAPLGPLPRRGMLGASRARLSNSKLGR